MEINKIYNEPCLETLKSMPDKSIDCVITSPPYWQLRDYGYDGQWGLEPTFYEYLEHLWQMMDEIYRVLKDEGTCWINLGDSYNNSGLAGKRKDKYNDQPIVAKRTKAGMGGQKDYPNKCLVLIPHRFAIGCIDRGWVVRNDIIWAKRNGMPEPVTDRFTKKHEFIFLMVKSDKYFFDLEEIKIPSQDHNTTKNPGSVSDFWDITTKPTSNKHFASYNDELLKMPILAGCPEFVCNKCGKPREKVFEYQEIIVSEKEFSKKYKDSGVNSAGGRATYITEKLKNQPNRIKIAQYLKSNKGSYTYSMLDEEFGYKDTAAHWFRTDSGFSLPSPSDWLKLKNLLKFDDTHDRIMTETVKVIVDDSGFKGKLKGLSDCGCNAGFRSGIVYDPFMGTGSTAEVALRTNRKFIGSEMSTEYIKICEKRLDPFFKQTLLF